MDGPGALQPSASWDRLRLRAELLKRVRRFFDERGFLEVETPILSADVVVDRHLDPIGVVLPDDPRRPDVGRSMWLQTSPEFAMKRLLAAGGQAIHQIARVFRAGECGPLHNPEFTMVEWYRVGDDLEAGMRLLGELCDTMLTRGEAECVSYREVFVQHAGLDPFTASLDELADAARRSGAADIAGADRDLWLDILLTERVRPHLGRSRPTIVHDYPARQAALARVREGDPPVAERFELYVDGVELANGYHELTDPAELNRRAEEQNRLRRADGKPTLPAESRLLAAMRCGLPASSGCALGFDRLVMLAAGASSIAKVTAFPIDRA